MRFFFLLNLYRSVCGDQLTVGLYLLSFLCVVLRTTKRILTLNNSVVSISDHFFEYLCLLQELGFEIPRHVQLVVIPGADNFSNALDRFLHCLVASKVC